MTTPATAPARTKDTDPRPMLERVSDGLASANGILLVPGTTATGQPTITIRSADAAKAGTIVVRDAGEHCRGILFSVSAASPALDKLIAKRLPGTQYRATARGFEVSWRVLPDFVSCAPALLATINGDPLPGARKPAFAPGEALAKFVAAIPEARGLSSGIWNGTTFASIYGCSIEVRESGNSLVLDFPYCAAVAAVRAVPGAKWDAKAKTWSVPAREAEALGRAMGDAHAAMIAADIAAADAKARAAREAREQRQRNYEWARETRAAAAAEARAAQPTVIKHEFFASNAPAVGEVLRLGGEAVVVTGLGKTWMLRDEDCCTYGLPPGTDAKMVYGYCRPATPAEAATLAAA